VAGSLVGRSDSASSTSPRCPLPCWLPANVQGIAGLAARRSLSRACLISVSSNDNRGVIFFGDGPYSMHLGVDVSSGLLYMPLTIRRRGKYFVRVRSIRINRKPVPLNASLLGNNVKSNLKFQDFFFFFHK
jgi:hypothetical protein